MKKKFVATFISLGAALTASWCTAQEQQHPAQEQLNSSASRQWAKDVAGQQNQTAQQVADAGTEAVTEAQEVNGAPVQDRQDAGEVLRKLMEKKGWKEG